MSEAALPSGHPMIRWLHATLARTSTRTEGRHAPCDLNAFRRILVLHPTNIGWYGRPDGECCDCQDDDGVVTGHEPCETKRIIADALSDQPGYRPEWGGGAG